MARESSRRARRLVDRWLLLCASVVAACGQPTTTVEAYAVEYVRFDDIAPPYLTLTQSWNALGLDDRDRAYILWTSTRNDGREDAALFRYTHATGQREFLGTFIDVATAQGNIQAGEQIPKGHTRIVQVGRKLYMGSQGFHDFKAEIDALPTYRGAHLFSYDLDSGAFDDVSRNLPGGVVIEHQGIISLAYSPEHELLVGLAHPLGDLVLFDVRTERVRKIVPGIPWQPNGVVSREILVTRTGKVLSYRGSEEPQYRELENEVWSYDLASDRTTQTGQWLKGGFWNGKAETRDRNTVYMSTVSGELYAFDVRSERFSHLGHFIDPALFTDPLQYRVHYLWGILLSQFERSIIGVPLLMPTAAGSEAQPNVTRLIAYDLGQRRFSQRGSLDVDVFTGSNHRDRAGNLYMSAFQWDQDCRLAVLVPGEPQAP